ncbi:MAG TPA: methyltransferase [Vicinamibacterales bacterium]|nr:methyltransferase [Vicinamibacterales bacterium]
MPRVRPKLERLLCHRSPEPRHLKEADVIIDRGPYRLVRHPIYFGVLVMLISTVLLRGRVGGLVFLAVVLTTTSPLQ